MPSSADRTAGSSPEPRRWLRTRLFWALPVTGALFVVALYSGLPMQEAVLVALAALGFYARQTSYVYWQRWMEPEHDRAGDRVWVAMTAIDGGLAAIFAAAMGLTYAVGAAAARAGVDLATSTVAAGLGWIAFAFGCLCGYKLLFFYLPKLMERAGLHPHDAGADEPAQDPETAIDE